MWQGGKNLPSFKELGLLKGLEEAREINQGLALDS